MLRLLRASMHGRSRLKTVVIRCVLTCILALCCHCKPNASTNYAKISVCPFCRSSITRLVVAKNKSGSETESHISPRKLGRTRETFNLGEGSRSFNNLSPFSSFGRLGRSSGKVSVELDEELDKP